MRKIVQTVYSLDHVFTELANTMNYGGGVLYNIFLLFKRVSGDVTAFHTMYIHVWE